MLHKVYTLPKIVNYEHCLYKAPAYTNVAAAGVAHVAVKCFGSCSTQKYKAQYIETVMVYGKEVKSVVRVKCFKYREVMQHRDDT